MDNTVASVAGEIFADLDSPADITTSTISAWLIGNVGALNDLIGTAIVIDDTNEFSPFPGDNEKVILKALYNIYYIQRQIRKNSGAAGTQSFMEIKEGDRLVRRTNYTEIAKALTTYLAQLRKELEAMILNYKSGLMLPNQIIVANPTTAEDFIPPGGGLGSYPYFFSNVNI